MKTISAFIALSLVIGIASHTAAQSAIVPPAPIFSELLSIVHLRDNGQFKPLRTYAYFMSADKGQ